MTRRLLMVAMLVLAGRARAERPCDDSVADPIPTPVRDVQLDTQRGACVRDALAADVVAHALVDTPGFHGDLGGDLVLNGSRSIARAHEVFASLQVVDYGFAQTAVNKASHAGIGPLSIGAASGGPIGREARAAVVARLELPYTRDGLDTLHTSAQLGGVVTGTLSPKTFVHGRLAALGMLARSLGGTATSLGFVAGADLAWQVRRRVALHLGADAMAGWNGGFDHLMPRGGVHLRPGGGAWRLRVGIGVPLAGAERTNVVLDVGVVVDR